MSQIPSDVYWGIMREMRNCRLVVIGVALGMAAVFGLLALFVSGGLLLLFPVLLTAWFICSPPAFSLTSLPPGWHKPDTDLDRPALARLTVAIGVEERLWRANVRHDHDARFYQQLYRDPNIDVWPICWVNGQGTGYYDHDRSSGAVYVCEGQLCEDCRPHSSDTVVAPA